MGYFWSAGELQPLTRQLFVSIYKEINGRKEKRFIPPGSTVIIVLIIDPATIIIQANKSRLIIFHSD